MLLSTNTRDNQNLSTLSHVSYNEHPVFFKVKPSSHVDHISSRESADKQMRKRYKDLGCRVEIPILYGMSALGTKVCFYTYDKGTRSILPRTIKDDGDLVIDTAPTDHWSLDVMMPDGERKLREVVNQVKAMCAQL